MKMSDFFAENLLSIDNEDITGVDDPCLCHRSGGSYAVFNTDNQAKAAAHAINKHDALVAMNAELNTALNEVSAMLTDIQDGFIMSEHETEMLDVVYKAQEKAKGLSQ